MVKMLEVICSGQFGPVRLSMPRAQVHRLFGEPENTAKSQRKLQAPDIWRYGTIELYFDPEGLLKKIFTDYLDPLDVGEGRPLDPWVLRKGLSSKEAAEALEQAGIAFSAERPAWGEGTVSILRTATGFEMLFQDQADIISDKLGLQAVSLQRVDATH